MHTVVRDPGDVAAEGANHRAGHVRRGEAPTGLAVGRHTCEAGKPAEGVGVDRAFEDRDQARLFTGLAGQAPCAKASQAASDKRPATNAGKAKRFIETSADVGNPRD